MNPLLFIICSLIWGCTWLAITYQLGSVNPMVSIFYRFLGAVIILFAYALATGRKLSFQVRDHLLFFLTGVLMFCFNYWLVYIAEAELTSGLVAILFSTMIFMNTVNNRIFLKSPIEPRIVLGGVVGLIGLGLVFSRDLLAFTLGSDALVAIGYGLLASFSASLGNTVAQVCHRRAVPVIPMELFAMAYGAAAMGTMALIRGVTFAFDSRFAYVGSL